MTPAGSAGRAGSGRFGAVEALLADAVAAQAFRAASAEVGTSTGAAWQAAFGALDDEGQRPARLDSVFDLASLTKVLVTTTLAMRQVDAGLVSVETRVASRLPRWVGLDRAHVTVGDLLAHTSGLSAYLPFYRDHVGRAEFEAAICGLPLEYTPRSSAVYSDLGFMLLGFLLEDAAARLDAQFAAVCADLALGDLTFRPPPSWLDRTAPAGHDAWRGRLIRGEVHDQNAWALGGVAGHAGLFGTAPAVGAFARRLMASRRGGVRSGVAAPTTIATFTRRTAVPGSSRALGWDTMVPTSSCGPAMGATAIGHTGFTGTSLWIDLDADWYFVLLTNRVHPDAGNEAILGIRPRFHSLAIDALRAAQP